MEVIQDHIQWLRFVLEMFELEVMFSAGWLNRLH